jgi:hypothetical protein
MRKIIFKILSVIVLFSLISCDIAIDGAPLGSISLDQLLVNQGQSLNGGVISILDRNDKSYQFSYNGSYLFYTTNLGTSSSWHFLPLSKLDGASIVNISPYYTEALVVPYILVMTNAPTNNIWICDGLNTDTLDCSSDIKLLPDSLVGHKVHNILGNANVQYAVVDKNVLLMSLNANHYEIMPNIPAIANNTPISAINVDTNGNLYVVFLSDTLGDVLYEFELKKAKWKLLLQNDQISGKIAANNNGDVYLLPQENNGSCDKNKYWIFTIKHIVDQKVSLIGMAINGCSNNKTSLLDINIDSGHRLYVTTKTGNYVRVYYTPTP